MREFTTIKKKPLIFAIAGVGVLIVLLIGIKAVQFSAMFAQAKRMVPPPTTVTSAPVKDESWQVALTAVGTLNAVQGVTLAAELAGKVVEIDFESGGRVEKGTILLRQDTSSEEAQLPGALAQVDLTRTNLERMKQLYAKNLIAQADPDTAVPNSQQAEAQAE